MYFTVLSRVSLFSLLLFTLFPFSPIHTHAHVVFEEIGTMAGSTSYIHLSLIVGLQDIEEKVEGYSSIIDRYYSLVNETFEEAIQEARRSTDMLSNERASKLFGEWRKYRQAIEPFYDQARLLRNKIRDLRALLPNPLSRPSRSIPGVLLNVAKKGLKLASGSSGGSGSVIGKIAKFATKGILRQVTSPGIIFSLARGILGTFMGLYTQRQIQQLRTEVEGIREEQERIVEVVTRQGKQIQNLTLWVQELQADDALARRLNTGLATAKLNTAYHQLYDQVAKAVHAVQQAQHRRVAIDLFSPEDLSDILEDLTSISSKSGFKLLTKNPSDLLQVETSYMYDGEGLVLILHVPMVPANSLLRLLRLRPFPIPLSKTHALLPRSPSSLLALSTHSPRFMTTIERTDLMGCHQVSNVYVCERHGVLNREVKASCLGALYEQDIPVARQLCDLELVPYKETILQLQNNWFLVYSPTMFTGYITCQNGTSSEVHIVKGVSRLYIDPTCFLDLKNHRLMSEYSLQLDAAIKYFKWESEDMSLFDLQEEDISEAVNEAVPRERGIFLSEVVAIRKSKFRFPSWKIMMAILGTIGALALGIVILMAYGARVLLSFRTRISKLKTSVISLIPELAEHLNRIARHLHFPQISLPRLYPTISTAPAVMDTPPPPFQE